MVQIMMLAPLIPFFAPLLDVYSWNKDVLEKKWSEINMNYETAVTL